jgi:hypothetical protein
MEGPDENPQTAFACPFCDESLVIPHDVCVRCTNCGHFVMLDKAGRPRTVWYRWWWNPWPWLMIRWAVRQWRRFRLGCLSTLALAALAIVLLALGCGHARPGAVASSPASPDVFVGWWFTDDPLPAPIDITRTQGDYVARMNTLKTLTLTRQGSDEDRCEVPRGVAGLASCPLSYQLRDDV